MSAPRIAVVTGASSGIGEATARVLAARGWRCVLVARRADRLQALAAEIGGEAESLVCDLGDRAAVEAAAAGIVARHPAIGLLVNNAGMPARGSFLDVEVDLVERVMQVNYLSGVWLTRGLLPALGPGSSIVNVASVAGTVAFAPAGAYAASKHAQVAFSRSLAAALSGAGVHVVTVMPGFVETEGFPQHGVLQSRLLRRFVREPGDVAEAIVEAVEKRKREVTVPWFPYRLAPVGQALLPGLMSRLVSRSGYKRGFS